MHTTIRAARTAKMKMHDLAEKYSSTAPSAPGKKWYPGLTVENVDEFAGLKSGTRVDMHVIGKVRGQTSEDRDGKSTTRTQIDMLSAGLTRSAPGKLASKPVPRNVAGEARAVARAARR